MHMVLIAKLHAYGFDKTALKFMKSYLSNRWQRTKINSSFSTRAELIIGVPQGSVLGPLLFNIFINDFFFIFKDTVVCNYADDNTLYTSDMKLDILMKKLECSGHKVKLLGVWIDSDLSFDDHMNNICRNAARKLNALSRQCAILPFYIYFYIYEWAYGVVVSMFDFHHSDRGSNPGRGGKIS